MEDVDIAAGFDTLPILEGEDPAEEIGDGPDAKEIEAGFAVLPQESGKRDKVARLPPGLGYRSHGHTALMRQQRKVLQAQRQTEQAQASHAALAHHWNAQHGLRRGEVVLHGSSGTQPNTWQPAGVLLQAWRQVGKRSRQARGPQGVGETRRPLDCLALVAAAALHAAQSSFHEWLSALSPQAPLHVERHYDPTGLLFSFGAFTRHVHKKALYLVSDGAGGYSKVTADDPLFTRKHRQPQQGCLEFFAQTLSVHTKDLDTGADITRDVLILPSVLSKASASATFSALEFKTPEFTRDMLLSLAAKHSVLTISEIADNNGVNKRKKLFSCRGSPKNLLHTPGGCVTHLLQRTITTGWQEKDFAGTCYSVWLVTRQPRYKELDK